MGSLFDSGKLKDGGACGIPKDGSPALMSDLQNCVHIHVDNDGGKAGFTQKAFHSTAYWAVADHDGQACGLFLFDLADFCGDSDIDMLDLSLGPIVEPGPQAGFGTEPDFDVFA